MNTLTRDIRSMKGELTRLGLTSFHATRCGYLIQNAFAELACPPCTLLLVCVVAPYLASGEHIPQTVLDQTFEDIKRLRASAALEAA